jgi:hypothetical protein
LRIWRRERRHDHAISPGIRSDSRVVARIRRAGQPTSSASATSAHASIRCSQLSRTSKSARGRKKESNSSRRECPAPSRTPSTVAIAWSTSAGSNKGASSTSQTPSAKASSNPRATWSARLVLRQPPVPVSVSSPVSVSIRRSRICAASTSRPMRVGRCAGRLDCWSIEACSAS